MAGSLFFADRGGDDHIRLCFACHSPDAIATGMRKLGLALRQIRPLDVSNADAEAASCV